MLEKNTNKIYCKDGSKTIYLFQICYHKHIITLSRYTKLNKLKLLI